MSFEYDSDLDPMDDGLAMDMDDEFEGFDEEDFLTLGIDPSQPTDAKPGSEDKVMTLAARYSAGLPLWHSEDRYDHGPGQLDPSIFGSGEDSALEDEIDEPTPG